MPFDIPISVKMLLQQVWMKMDKLVLVCLLFAGNISAEYPKDEIQYTFIVSNYRAAELLAAGDTSGALVILDNTISRQPENHVALLDRGRLQLIAGNREAASRDFTAALYSPIDSIRIAAHTGLAWHSRGVPDQLL